MKLIVILAIIAVIFGASFASAIELQSPKEIMRDPLGNGGLVPGMSKDRVIDKYGEPDMKRDVISDEWQEPREEWFYRARYGMLPVNAGYLADDMYLYFDGNNLTRISKKPIGRGATEVLGVKGGKEIVE